jgi:hypothetical protein
MNETEVMDKPVDDGGIMLDPNDFIEQDESIDVEDTTEPTTEEVSKPTETEVKEMDFKPLFEELSKKIKYKDEPITIDNLEDIIENYQKGKNYGTLQEKLDAVANGKQMKLIEKLAKESNMSMDDYVDYVERTQEQSKIDEMVSQGATEEMARKVLNAERIEREIREKAEQTKAEEQKRIEQAKVEADNQEFITAFPDVNVKDIPKEVFINAKNNSLKSAYTEYLYKEAIQKIERLEISKQSPVRGAKSSVELEKVDDFLSGLLG